MAKTKKAPSEELKNGLKTILPLAGSPETASIRFASDLIVTLTIDPTNSTLEGTVIDELTDEVTTWTASFGG